MDAETFYTHRKDNWERLSNLLQRSEQNITRLTQQEIEQLGQLYRMTSSDLALARRDFPEHRITRYLNQLVARAHTVVYRSEPLAYQRIIRYFTTTLPRTFRASWPFILAASLMFILPAIASLIATYLAPSSGYWLLPPSAQDVIPLIQNQDLWVDIPVAERPYASSFIMQNNIRVSFLAFGSGMTAGILTLWVMVMNGLMLGAITGLTLHYGVGFELWTFVIGHGVVELSVIMIAGGSGLMLGWAIIKPGLVTRREALTAVANKAIRLLIGCVPLLILAGTIEGFISPNETIPPLFKWMTGLITGLILYAYLLLAGHERRDKTRPPTLNR